MQENGIYLSMKNLPTRFLTAALLAAGCFAASPLVAQDKPAVLRMPVSAAGEVLPDAPVPEAQANQPQTTEPAKTAADVDPTEGQQSKRILGIIPNFRSVSVDQKLPPLKPWEKFKLAASDSFDYSSFIYVGMLAGVAQAQNSTPEFHQGAAGFGRYYWHSFADNTDGNFFTEAIMPSVTHEDPRYYTLGRGGFARRFVYSVGRLVVTRTDNGARTFNVSEIVGNGAAAGISDLYYPSPERTWTKTGQRWILQIGLDGASNVLKEFWPDIAHGLFHEKEASDTSSR
jgi:hypothetical protein